MSLPLLKPFQTVNRIQSFTITSWCYQIKILIPTWPDSTICVSSARLVDGRTDANRTSKQPGQVVWFVSVLQSHSAIGLRDWSADIGNVNCSSVFDLCMCQQLRKGCICTAILGIPASALFILLIGPFLTWDRRETGALKYSRWR